MNFFSILIHIFNYSFVRFKIHSCTLLLHPNQFKASPFTPSHKVPLSFKYFLMNLPIPSGDNLFFVFSRYFSTICFAELLKIHFGCLVIHYLCIKQGISSYLKKTFSAVDGTSVLSSTHSRSLLNLRSKKASFIVTKTNDGRQNALVI